MIWQITVRKMKGLQNNRKPGAFYLNKLSPGCTLISMLGNESTVHFLDQFTDKHPQILIMLEHIVSHMKHMDGFPALKQIKHINKTEQRD